MNITRANINQSQPNFGATFHFGNAETKIHLIKDTAAAKKFEESIIPALKKIGDINTSQKVTMTQDNKWHVGTRVASGQLMTEQEVALSTEKGGGNPVSIDEIVETAKAFEEAAHHCGGERKDVINALNSAAAAKAYTALSKLEGR